MLEIVTSHNPQNIELFMSLFQSRRDVYARRWEKDGRSGYNPAYEFNWDEFMAHKSRGGSLKDFHNKRLIPLSRDVIRRHLLGVDVIGIYPILSDNTSYVLAADFDGETWKKDAIAFVEACTKVGLRAYLERSRSGDGGHVWIFFPNLFLVSRAGGSDLNSYAEHSKSRNLKKRPVLIGCFRTKTLSQKVD